ncbi:MAG: protein kinase, partial [Anaerolineales bacterium]|nr:protein kinase [Anaerolineales bacterium]
WRHPNIVQIYHAGEENGRFYFAMEYIDGIDLAERLTTQPLPLPFAEVMRVGTAVAAALDYAHAQGVVHRDVKPA